jgi:hypothetical protein
MENGGVNFIMPNSPDTVVLQFAALALTPTVHEPTEALDEDNDDNIELVVRPPLSPRKPKSKPGPKRKATADLSRKFPPPATHLTREKRAFTTAFKLGVLSYATYGSHHVAETTCYYQLAYSSGWTLTHHCSSWTKDGQTLGRLVGLSKRDHSIRMHPSGITQC